MVNGFWGNIFKETSRKESNDLSIYKAIPILNGLSKEELKEFEHIAHHRHYKADEIFFGRASLVLVFTLSRQAL